MKTIDPKALKIILDYHPAYPEKTPPDDFDYAKTAGLAFERVKMTHDQIVQWALTEFAKCNKEKIVAAYLIGTGKNLPHLRAGLAAYAVMTHFPKHTFETVTERYCATCAMTLKPELDLTFINSCRWAGTIIGRSPDVLAFYLQQHNADDVDEPSETDIQKFIDVLDVIDASTPEEKPSTLYKKIRKVPTVKMSDEEGRHFLNTLGYAGILQTPEHKGFIYKYIGHIVPTKSHSSDWHYPVDFWTGKNGVNADALKYWFSAYPKITRWKSKR
jgi:hypothetical protein